MQPIAASLQLTQLLLFVGGALVLWYAFSVSAGSLAVPMLGAQFGKLLRARNLARAVKLSCAGDYPVLVASRGVLEALERGLVLGPVESGDYRSDAVDRSPDAVLAALRAKFVAGYHGASARWRRRRALGGAGALLLSVAAALTARGEGPTWVYAPSAAAALVFGWALFRQRKQGLDALAMFESLRAELYETAMNPGAEPAPAGAIVEGRGLRFEVHEPGLAARTFVARGPILKVGRAAGEGHLALESAQVARLHAVIEVRGGEVSLIDLGSNAGTRVNGEPVNKRALADGDLVEFGPVRAIVRFDEAALVDLVQR